MTNLMEIRFSLADELTANLTRKLPNRSKYLVASRHIFWYAGHVGGAMTTGVVDGIRRLKSTFSFFSLLRVARR